MNKFLKTIGALGIATFATGSAFAGINDLITIDPDLDGANQAEDIEVVRYFSAGTHDVTVSSTGVVNLSFNAVVDDLLELGGISSGCAFCGSLEDLTLSISLTGQTADGTATGTSGTYTSGTATLGYLGDPRAQFSLLNTTGGFNIAFGTVTFGGLQFGAGSMSDFLVPGFLFDSNGNDLLSYILAGAPVLAIGTGSASISDISTVDGTRIYTVSGTNGSVTFRIPEPGTVAMFGLGLLGLGAAARRRRKAA